MRPEGQAFSGGSFGCLRLKCKTSLQFWGGGWGGGVDLERVDVYHLGLSGGMLPHNIFNFKAPGMAVNAFKTITVW